MAAVKIPRHVPFADWDDWLHLASVISTSAAVNYSTSMKEILQIVSMWRSRGKVPHSVESTADMLEIVAADHNYQRSNEAERSEQELRMLYSIAIIRSVNGLVDAEQQGQLAAMSIMNVAEKIGLPSWIAEIRHDATHNQLPPLSVLRSAAQQLLRWFSDRYWTPQASLLNSLTRCCIPSVMLPSASVDNRSSDEMQKQNRVTFKSMLANASSTFLVDFFIPAFLSAAIFASNGQSTKRGRKFENIERHLAQQRNAWEPLLSKAFSSFPLLVFPFLCNLLNAGSTVMLKAGRTVRVKSDNINDNEFTVNTLHMFHWQLQVVDHWAVKVLDLVDQLKNPVRYESRRYGCNNIHSPKKSFGSNYLYEYIITTYTPMMQTALHRLQFNISYLQQQLQQHHSEVIIGKTIADAGIALSSKFHSQFPQIISYESSNDVFFRHQLFSSSDDEYQYHSFVNNEISNQVVVGEETDASIQSSAAFDRVLEEDTTTGLNDLEKWLSDFSERQMNTTINTNIQSTTSSANDTTDTNHHHIVGNKRNERSSANLNDNTDSGPILKRMKIDVVPDIHDTADTQLESPPLIRAVGSNDSGLNKIVLYKNCPTWPIGCLPGMNTTGQLLQIHSID